MLRFAALLSRCARANGPRFFGVITGIISCGVLLPALAGPPVPAAGRGGPDSATTVRTAPVLRLIAAQAEKGLRVTSKDFGKTPDGIATHLYTITNASGATLELTDYGARIAGVNVPDRSGKLANVNLGFDSLEKYIAHQAYFGCTTGRFANRIANAKFSLEGKEYKLAANNGPSSLHGGTKGFDRRVWKAEPVSNAKSAGVQFSYKSPDGEEGYPGTLSTTVTIRLTNDNSVQIDYEATTDKPTALNLTNHAYWNLSGAGAGPILKHKLSLEADSFLAVDEHQIPTGKVSPVHGTCMDFTQPQELGSRIAETKSGTLPVGYDHCYVLRGKLGELRQAARVEDPASGRIMEVLTTEPAIQLYTGNFLDGNPINGGHKQHTAFCLETQHYPDSPNHPDFPTTVLKPGEKYQSTTIYKFSAK